jgi:hypothetical protein
LPTTSRSCVPTAGCLRAVYQKLNEIPSCVVRQSDFPTREPHLSHKAQPTPLSRRNMNKTRVTGRPFQLVTSVVLLPENWMISGHCAPRRAFWNMIAGSAASPFAGRGDGRCGGGLCIQSRVAQARVHRRPQDRGREKGEVLSGRREMPLKSFIIC